MDTERNNSDTTDTFERQASTRSDAAHPVSEDQSLATAREEDLDETNAEDVNLARPEWGSVAMLAAAASFGAAVPGAVAAANRQTFMSVERYGEFSISNGGGPIGQLTKEEIAAKKQEEADDGWTDWARDMAEAREEQERVERERKWDAEMHDFAGMQMSGPDIDALMDFVRDPKQRQALIERRAKEKNISTQQAAKDVDNALRYGELFKKVEQKTATNEEAEEFRKMKSDPAIAETWKSAKKQMTEDYATPDATVTESRVATTAVSTSSAADVLDNNFPTAPPVKEHFEQAKAASVPLDSKLVQLAATTPVAPPLQVASSGFDV